MTLDDRSFVMQCVNIMDIPTSVVYFYPRLIPLHEIQNGTETPEIPNPIRCTVEKMTDNGVYLLGMLKPHDLDYSLCIVHIHCLTMTLFVVFRKWYSHVIVDWVERKSRLDSECIRSANCSTS